MDSRYSEPGKRCEYSAQYSAHGLNCSVYCPTLAVWEIYISKKDPVDAVSQAPWHSAGKERQGKGRGVFLDDPPTIEIAVSLSDVIIPVPRYLAKHNHTSSFLRCRVFHQGLAH